MGRIRSHLVLKRNLASWALLPLLAAAIVAADQWTKGWIENNIPFNGSLTPFPALEPYFKLVYWSNTGAAFGILQGQASLFILIAVVVIVAVLVYARQLPAEGWAVRACLGLQLGGAVGNLIDRLEHAGHVTDFLLFTLPVGERVYMWPAWNIADGAIVVGTILLGILLLRAERQRPQEVGTVQTTETGNANTDQN